MISEEREKYLNSGWSPYPRAQSDWLTPADDIEVVYRPKVCGRLTVVDLLGLVIEWNGQRLSAAWSAGPIDLFTRNPISKLVFIPGDLVVLDLEKRPGFWHVAAIGMLAPCLESEFKSQAGWSVESSSTWMKYINEVRGFFQKSGFIELGTPTLVPCPGTEPFLDAFETTFQMGSVRQKFYLPTSPEYHLKRALTDGWARIFEIKSCFRNQELSDHHQPEFTMLEWYRAFQPIERLIDDIKKLVAAVWPLFKSGEPPAVLVTGFPELFQKLEPGFLLSPSTSIEEMRSLAARLKVNLASDDNWNDIFFRIVLEKLEPMLATMGPVIIYGYPATQTALARVRDDGWADRFEFYWNGLEIANAFCELNDPLENRRRQLDDIEKRKLREGAQALELDEGLLRALRLGMPPSAGIALGVERLFMALTDIKDIRATRAYTHFHP